MFTEHEIIFTGDEIQALYKLFNSLPESEVEDAGLEEVFEVVKQIKEEIDFGNNDSSKEV